MEQSVCSDVKEIVYLLLHGLCSVESSIHVMCVSLRCTGAGKYDMTCLPHTRYLATGRLPSCYRLFSRTRVFPTCSRSLLRCFCFPLGNNLSITDTLRTKPVRCVCPDLIIHSISPTRPLLARSPICYSCTQEASGTNEWQTHV